MKILNIRSPHAKAWDKYLHTLEADTFIVNSHPKVAPILLLPCLVIQLTKAAVWGLWQCIGSHNRTVVEAHGAGRAGLLAAALPFKTVTIVHGSEVLMAKGVHALLWKFTLKRSSYCVVTTRATADFIVGHYPGLNTPLRVCHPGVPWEDLMDLARSECDSRTAISIRRTLPHYNIATLLDAHRLLRGDYKVRLTVIRGDVDQSSAYMQRVRKASNDPFDDRRVVWIDEFLDESRFQACLGDNAIAISLAQSDQLSISVLEALGTGAIMILTDLDAYGPLRELPQVIVVPPKPTSVQLASALRAAVQLSSEQPKMLFGSARARDAQIAFEAEWPSSYAEILKYASSEAR